MDKYQGVEWNYFLWSVLCGVLMAFIYDLVRAKRIGGKKQNTVVVNALDILWFIGCGIALFFAAYYKNAGEFRFYSVIAFGLGFILYRLTLKNRAARFFGFIYNKTARFICCAIKILLFPVERFCKLINRPIKVIGWHTRRKAGGVFERVKLRVAAAFAGRGGGGEEEERDGFNS